MKQKRSLTNMRTATLLFCVMLLIALAILINYSGRLSGLSSRASGLASNKILLDTAKQYSTATDPVQKDKSYQALVGLAAQHKDALRKLMKDNPDQALSLALTEADKRQFPPEITGTLEKTGVQIQGKLIPLHADSADKNGKPVANGKVESYFSVETADKQRYLVHTSKQIAPGNSYATASINQAVILDSELAVAANNLTFVPQGQAPAAPATPAAYKTAVVLFNFASNPIKFIDDKTFTTTNQLASDYFVETSYSKTKLASAKNDTAAVDRYGWYTITSKPVDCNQNWWNWSREALLQAQRNGLKISDYNSIVYAFPYSGCFFGGVATVNGPWSAGVTQEAWLQFYDPYVLVHELGHNMGAMHASYLYCPPGVNIYPYSESCNHQEYGDVKDVMGTGYIKQFNAFHKYQAGWLPASRTRTVTASGKYALVPTETAGSSIVALKISRNDNYYEIPLYYYIEYRKQTRFDDFAAGDSAITGLSIYIAPDTVVPPWPMNTFAIKADAGAEWWDSYRLPLPIGQTFTDPDRGISITNNGVTTGSASVTVNLGPRP